MKGLLISLALVTSLSFGGGKPRHADEYVIFHTIAGDLLFSLFPDIAPETVAQFLKLTHMGVYDTTHFYRSDRSFVLQLSTAQDRLIPLNQLQINSIKKLPLEVKPNVIHKAGVLSMARYDGDPNSAETSFSILLTTAPHLDTQYTIFGHLERGADVLVELLKVPTNSSHKPDARLTVLNAEVVTKKELAKKILAPATPIRGIAEVSTASTMKSHSPFGALGIGLLIAFSVILFLLARKMGNRWIASIALAQILVGAFFLLVILNPITSQTPLLAAGMFLGLMGLFRLMAQFEV